jgi:hypothetical protein
VNWSGHAPRTDLGDGKVNLPGARRGATVPIRPVAGYFGLLDNERQASRSTRGHGRFVEEPV